jgi:hypothetical protein
MATNTWSSTGSTDGNLGSNWSLGALSATDALVYDAASVVIMAAGQTVNVTTVNAGDIEGSAGKIIEFNSSAPGTYWNYGNPATAQTVDWISVTGSNASNPITVNKPNSINGEHNSNWNFKTVRYGAFRK